MLVVNISYTGPADADVFRGLRLINYNPENCSYDFVWYADKYAAKYSLAIGGAHAACVPATTPSYLPSKKRDAMGFCRGCTCSL